MRSIALGLACAIGQISRSGKQGTRAVDLLIIVDGLLLLLLEASQGSSKAKSGRQFAYRSASGSLQSSEICDSSSSASIHKRGYCLEET